MFAAWMYVFFNFISVFATLIQINTVELLYPFFGMAMMLVLQNSIFIMYTTALLLILHPYFPVNSDEMIFRERNRKLRVCFVSPLVCISTFFLILTGIQCNIPSFQVMIRFQFFIVLYSIYMLFVVQVLD